MTDDPLLTAAKALMLAVQDDEAQHGGTIGRRTLQLASLLRIQVDRAERAAQAALPQNDPASYDRGRRDVLNAILAPNIPVAAKVAYWAEKPADPEGRIPFNVALWVTEVAEQLGIKSVEELAEAGEGAS